LQRLNILAEKVTYKKKKKKIIKLLGSVRLFSSAFRFFKGKHKGKITSEVKKRFNILKIKKKSSVIIKFLEKFKDPLVRHLLNFGLFTPNYFVEYP
jgi:hypothetical protein